MAKKRVGLDDGHGINTPGKRTPFIKALGRQIRENEWNKAVMMVCKEALERSGVEVVLLAPTDEDTPLRARTDKANREGVDVTVSFHYDALDGDFDGPGKDPEGFTVFHYPGSTNGKKLAECISKEMAKGTPQQNRGVKGGNLHMVREGKMPGVLVECGFMDNEREALLMVNVDFQKEVGEEVARGVCNYLGVKFVEKKVVTKPVTETKAATSGDEIGTAVVVQGVILREEPNYKEDGIIRWLNVGESYKVYGESGIFYNLGGGYASKSCFKFTKK